MSNVFRYLLAMAVALFAAAVQPAYAQKGKGKKPSVEIIQSALGDSSLRSTEYYLRAVTALNASDDTLKALAYCKEALADDSLHAPSFFMVSTLLSDPSQAMIYNEKASLLDPDNVWYKLQLGLLYGSSGEYRKSLDVVLAVHNRGNRNSQTYRYLAALYDVLGDNVSATEMIDSALMLYGDDPDLLMFKGEALKKNGNHYAYLDNAKRVAECMPDDVDAAIKLSEAYLAVKQDSMAEVVLQRAYAVDPSDVDLIVAMTEYYEWKKDYPNFFAFLEKIFETDDSAISLKNKISYFDRVVKNPFYYRNYITYIQKLLVTLRVKYDYRYDVEDFYAKHLIGIGETKEAAEIYKKFLNNDTLSVASVKEVYNTVISIEDYLQDTASVLQYVALAEKKFKDDEEEPLFLAYILTDYDFKRAVTLLEKKIPKLRSDSMKSVYYCNIGDLYHQKEDYATCFKYYDKSLAKDPNNIMTLNNYAYFMSLRNESLDKALAMIDRVLVAEPSSAVYIDTKAWILYLMGQYAEAKELQRRALALDTTKSSELMLHYADILAAMGDKIGAEVSYRKALERGADEEEVKTKIENLNKE